MTMDEKKAKHIITLVFLVMPLVFFLMLGGYSLLTRNTYNSILANCAIVEGTVSRVTRNGFPRGGTDTLIIDYTVDGKDYKTAILAESGKVQTGDTMELLYSTKTPGAAITDESYSYMAKSNKTSLIVAGIIFAVMLIIWIILVPVADSMEKRAMKGRRYNQQIYDAAYIRNHGLPDEVHTSYGTIKRNSKYRK